MIKLTVANVTGVLHTTDGKLFLGLPTEVHIDGNELEFTFYRAAAGATGQMTRFDLAMGTFVSQKVVTGSVSPADDVTVFQRIEVHG